MKNIFLTSLFLILAVTTFAQEVDSNKVQEAETFEIQQGDSTIVMQKYFMVFLKSGPERSQNEEEAQEIQKNHMAHLTKLAEDGKTSITGPMAEGGDIRGIVIFNTATKEEAKRLAEQDPAVKAGRLTVEVHPWWAAKGSKLK